MKRHTKRYTKYLQLRNGIYYFRFKIPMHLQSFTSKKEIVRSLKTDSFNYALSLVVGKSSLIRFLKMTVVAPDQLQQLFDEMSDFTYVDSFNSDQRFAGGDGRDESAEMRWFVEVADIVRSDLIDNRMTDFWFTKTKPSMSDFESHKKFQRMFLYLNEVMEKRAMYPSEPLDKAAIMEAQEILGSRNESKELLSVYFEKFAQFKTWTDKQLNANQNLFRFMLSHWGDVDVRSITKRNIKSALDAYERMPQGNKNPYRKMTIEERYKSFVLSDERVPDEDLLAAKSVRELLKLMQGFFNVYLTSEIDLLSSSPTKDVRYVFDDVIGGIYTDKEICMFIEYAVEQDGWKKWVILLAVYTGARRGEIIKFLSQGVEKDESGLLYFELKEGKTKNAIRKIPVHQRLIAFGVEKAPAENVQDYSVTRYLNAVRDFLGIPLRDEDQNKRVFHAFRHSFVTKATAKNTSVEMIQELVGHSKAQAGITKRYIHKLPLVNLLEVVNSIEY